MAEPRTSLAGQSLINRQALAVQVADALRELILEGELKGGEKIREKELTERFGVSRTPLREAMKMLASEGLIELVPNRGSIISQPSTQTLADTFPVLATLEGLAGELAALRATDTELDEIARLTRKLRTTLEDMDRPRYFQFNQSIHQAILTASRNEILARTHATISWQIHRARYQANLARTRWEKALLEHEEIAEALLARDGQKVGGLLRNHMIAKLDAILSTQNSAIPADRSEADDVAQSNGGPAR